MSAKQKRLVKLGDFARSRDGRIVYDHATPADGTKRPTVWIKRGRK